MRTAKQIFFDELSGEPLSEDAVIWAIKRAMIESIRECAIIAKTKTVQTINQPYGDVVYSKIVDKDSMLKLIDKL